MWCDLGILAACGSYLAGPGSHAATQCGFECLRPPANPPSKIAAVADQMFNSEDEVIWDTGFGCLECYGISFRECTGGALVRKPQLGVAGDFIWTPSFHFMFNAGLVISAVLPTRGLQRIYR